MTATLESFRQGFPDFILMTGTAGILLLVASTIYILLTPWKELALVRGGNGAAGLGCFAPPAADLSHYRHDPARHS